MNIIKNAITEETAELATKRAIELLGQDVWDSNRDVWSKELLYGTSGKVLITKLDSDIRKLVLDDISDQLPYYNDLTANFHVGLAESGISMHNDAGHRFGATIYLNKVWHQDFGGLFLWMEDENNPTRLKGYIPEYRSMVLNDEGQDHMVTRVAPKLSEIRLTIQIFGN